MPQLMPQKKPASNKMKDPIGLAPIGVVAEGASMPADPSRDPDLGPDPDPDLDRDFEAEADLDSEFLAPAIADPASPSLPNIQEIMIDAADHGRRLDVVLAEKMPALSRSRLKNWIEKGRVRLAGGGSDELVLSEPAMRVRAGAIYRLLVPLPEPSIFTPEKMDLVILHEDAHLLVLDKPIALAVHPAPGSWTGTLVHGLLAHCGEELLQIGAAGRPGIVHRLDKDTSGVMVVAKSEIALHSLGKQFHAKSVERQYRALCVGMPNPPSGRIETRIGRDPHHRQKMAVLPAQASAGRNAITHYQWQHGFGRGVRGFLAGEIGLRLETGRTHQIRVHMAHQGCPLIGDPTYGGSRASRALDAQLRQLAPDFEFSHQALHAEMLGFRHPVTQDWLRFETKPPDDWCKLRDLLQQLA